MFTISNQEPEGPEVEFGYQEVGGLKIFNFLSKFGGLKVAY